MTDDNAPVRLASNEYWGRKSGTIDQRSSSPTYRQPIFQIPRPGPKSGGNSGPTGKRHTRWYQGRFGTKPPVSGRKK